MKILILILLLLGCLLRLDQMLRDLTKRSIWHPGNEIRVDIWHLPLIFPKDLKSCSNNYAIRLAHLFNLYWVRTSTEPVSVQTPVQTLHTVKSTIWNDRHLIQLLTVATQPYFNWTVLRISLFNILLWLKIVYGIWLCCNCIRYSSVKILLVLVNKQHATTCDTERLLRGLCQGITVTFVGQTYTISRLIQAQKRWKPLFRGLISSLF